MELDLVSPALRLDFREFCVNYLVLRQIDDCFTAANIRKGNLPADRITSGQRRTLVEEYYSSLNWSDKKDSNKFLNAIQLVLSQSYLQGEPRRLLLVLLEREGYTLDGLQIRKTPQSVVPTTTVDPEVLAKLSVRWVDLINEEPHRRGFSFEVMLGEVFEAFGLAPKKSFRLLGEQIDGSFQVGADTYLVEAKWHKLQTSQADLLIFREKVESKSTWARGLFISYSGFSEDGLAAFGRGRSTNIIGMDGQDLFFVLSGKMSLPDAISKKVRRAAETGEFFTPVLAFLYE